MNDWIKEKSVAEEIKRGDEWLTVCEKPLNFFSDDIVFPFPTLKFAVCCVNRNKMKRCSAIRGEMMRDARPDAMRGLLPSNTKTNKSASVDFESRTSTQFQSLID